MSVEYENLLPQNSNFSLSNKKHFKEATSSINSDEIQKSRTLTENSFFSETKGSPRLRTAVDIFTTPRSLSASSVSS